MPRFPGPLAAFFGGINVLVYRLFARRRFMGNKLLLLNTVGAKTGKTRLATLGRFPEGDNAWLIVGSASGDARHPAWYLNLAKNPDKVSIEFEGRTVRVRPESLKGAEREAAWQRVVSEAPMYNRYLEKTDREIPIVRLTAEAPN
jgi:deazaflavin-dependent oxidoreductase (nitroreductase family)